MNSGGGRPGRILHLIETGGPGGAETVLLGLVGALAEKGWTSRVVLPEADWLFQRLSESGEEVVVSESHRSADLGHLADLCQEIRRFKPGLVHAHLLGSGVYGSLAARMAGGVPVVTTFHGGTDVDPDDPLLWLKGRILKRSRNRIVYVSADLRAYLEPLLRLPVGLGRVIHNGVVYVERASESRLRAELGLGSGHVVVGAMGNLRKAKDYPNLLAAAAIARRERPELRFVVVGGGSTEARDALLELRSRLGLEDAVHFLGFREDVREIMSAFDLFVSSSSSEGLPLATLEAMGMGLPAVLTACGGPSEIVIPGETGVLVPPRDPGALARAVVEMTSDRERARRIGERGREDVRRRFSADKMFAGYLNLYAEVLGA